MLDAPHRSAAGLSSTPAPARAVPEQGTALVSGATTIASGGGLTDRYAAALYAHADEQHLLDTVVSEMETLGRTIDASADFRRLLGSPLIDVNQATRAALAVLEQEGYSKPVRDFVGVVAANRRLRSLRGIVQAFASLVAERRGIVTAQVATAHPLTDVQRQQLRARLIEAGYGNVNIHRVGGTRPARRPRRADRRPAIRHVIEIPPAAPAVRHEGSRLIWRSAPPRSRRS